MPSRGSLLPLRKCDKYIQSFSRSYTLDIQALSGLVYFFEIGKEIYVGVVTPIPKQEKGLLEYVTVFLKNSEKNVSLRMQN